MEEKKELTLEMVSKDFINLADQVNQNFDVLQKILSSYKEAILALAKRVHELEARLGHNE